MSTADVSDRPPRPRPAINSSTEWFWDGCRAHELRIQRCDDCSALHHPPVVRCPACGSMSLGHQAATGRATLHSHAVVEHPQVPSFDYPLVVGLVDLEEGTRLVTNVTDVAPDDLEVGMALELHWLDGDPPLHQFRPARRGEV